MAYISLTAGGLGTGKQIHFQPTDFLVEAIEEFLESGAKATKIGSCVIRIAAATELILKDTLRSYSRGQQMIRRGWPLALLWSHAGFGDVRRSRAFRNPITCRGLLSVVPSGQAFVIGDL